MAAKRARKKSKTSKKRASTASKRKTSKTAANRARAKAKSKKKRSKKRSSARATDPIVLRTRTDVDIEVPAGVDMQEAAMRWTYVLRHRRRWAERPSARIAQAKECRQQMEDFGFNEQLLRDVAEAGLVEVGVPYTTEENEWEARIFPWEYMLADSTRDLRRGRSLTVVRNLARKLGRAPKLGDSARLLIVESAPGALQEDFSFASERRLVRTNLGLKEDGVRVLQNPTRGELESTIKDMQPGVLHLTGFDSLVGLVHLEGDPNIDVPDGYLLSHDDGTADPVPALELARLVNAGTRKPQLVACNFYHSAARTAALCVGEGAGAAIGFQDEFEDSLTELFFANFYRAWRLSEGDLHEAFQLAWNVLRNQPRGLAGTGLVLWSARSFRDPRPALPGGQPRAAADAAKANLEERVRQEKGGRVEVTDRPVSELFQVEVKPLEHLNYSMMHNDQPLFESFVLRKFVPERIEGLFIGVELHVGAENYPFRLALSLDEDVKNLNDRIRIPLTSALGRSQRESVHTSLFVEVLWTRNGASHELYRETHRVTLLPVDEWRDDDENRIWLPSFVLPRDEAVRAVVDSAQRYLMALIDDPTAGFDGYQSYDETADDPSEAIDLQVQALWAALSYEQSLAYINPPPAYTAASQRVRTPSDVIDGHRGTCIDLTLLLAACLEYVEIYPVVFLLQGHAFPGYWRSEAAHEEFRQIREPSTTSTSGVRRDSFADGDPKGQRYAWYFEKSAYKEIIELVRAEELVPLESVSLTSARSFWGSIDEGFENLRSKREFDAMIDVVLARESQVTPIPIWRQR